MKYNLTEITDLIKERRTIGPEKYRSRKVHREQIEKMLEAAHWAPNHGHTEPWRFTVFSGESLRQLMTLTAELYKKLTPEESFLQSKYDRFLQRAEQSSYVIAVGMKRQETGKIPEIEEVEAVACAVQNMLLVATAYGVGTFWATGKMVYAEQMKEFLGLGEQDKCLGLIYVGYPEGEWPKGQRSYWKTKVEWRE